MHVHLSPDSIYPFDARGIAKRFRHAAIFGALDALRAGETMRFVNDHDPLPLLDQLAQRYGAAVEISTMLRWHALVNVAGFLGLGLLAWSLLRPPAPPAGLPGAPADNRAAARRPGGWPRWTRCWPGASVRVPPQQACRAPRAAARTADGVRRWG